MQSDNSRFGLRGFLIDVPEFGTLRGRANGAVLIAISSVSANSPGRKPRRARKGASSSHGRAVLDLASLLPYSNHNGLAKLMPEDVVALCIYRGGPQANLETYVRGRCIYRSGRLARQP